AHKRRRGPWGHAPVKVCLRHGLVQGFHGAAFDGVWWGSDVIREWLGRAVEEQTHADACAEHHGNPGKTAKFRLLVIFTEFDAAELRKAYVGHDDDRHDHRKVQQPAGIGNSPTKSGG